MEETPLTKIKLCGLTRPQDIAAANACRPDYIGFVFWPKSRRLVTPAQARELRAGLAPGIQVVGVFVDADPAEVATLLQEQIIDIAQLHGQEDESYLSALRALTPKPLWQAFRVHSPAELQRAARSSADCILLDSGTGSGQVFDWQLLQTFQRPYFLAGGLTPANAAEALRTLHPYGVDVSSGIETDRQKDPAKMRAFVHIIRSTERS